MIIKLKKIPRQIKGAYGSYIKLSRSRGLKIFFDESMTYEQFTYCNLRFPDSWCTVLAELTFLELAQVSGISPKLYGLRLVEVGSKLYPAIEMEHFEGIKLSNRDFNRLVVINGKAKLSPNKIQGRLDVFQYIDETLTNHRITHSDLHQKNIIIKKNKEVKVIDFSSEFISITRKEKIFCKVFNYWSRQLKIYIKQAVTNHSLERKKFPLWWMKTETILSLIQKENRYFQHTSILKDCIVTQFRDRNGHAAELRYKKLARKISRSLNRPIQTKLSSHGASGFGVVQFWIK